MASPVRSLSAIAQNKSSRLIHTLKNAEAHSTVTTPKDHPLQGRTFAYSSSPGYDHSNQTVDNEVKTKVNEWSNCLRATLLSNLSPYHAARSKYISTNSGNDMLNNRFYSPSMDESVQSVFEKQTNNELYGKDEPSMFFEHSDNGMTNKGPTPDKESNWATSLQKTVDLNMDDTVGNKLNREQKNLSMDINVVVKIKPHENENKIGFQKINHNEEFIKDQNSKHVAACNEIKDASMMELEHNVGTDDQSDRTSYLESINGEGIYNGCFAYETTEEQGDYISQDVLIEELGEVYTSYKNQKNITARVDNENVLDPVLRSVNKVKKLYLQSLSSPHSATSTGQSGFTDSSMTNPLEVSGLVSCNARTFLPNNFLKRRSQMGPVRTFTTSSVIQTKKDDCNKANKLPCLQASELSKTKAHLPTEGKGGCEKFCMPCCKPARDPPECFFPYTKPPCPKLKPPRPAFSECKQIFPLQMVQPCECIRGIGSSCKKSKDSAKCSK